MSSKRRAPAKAKASRPDKKRKYSDDTESLPEDRKGVLLSDNPADFVTETTPGKTKIKSLLSSKSITSVKGLLNTPRGALMTIPQFGPKAIGAVDDFVRTTLGFTDEKLKAVDLENPPLLAESEEISVVDPNISASDLLAKSIGDFAFTTQTKNKLMDDNLTTVEQILQFTPKKFGNLHKVGKVSLKVFEEIYKVALENGALERIGVQPALIPEENTRKEKPAEKQTTEVVEAETTDEPNRDPPENLNEILQTEISVCENLTPNKLNSLHSHSITTVGDLLRHPPSALTSFDKIGRQTVDILRTWLTSGLGLPDSTDLSHLDLWNDDLVEDLGEHKQAPFFVDESGIKLAKRKVPENKEHKPSVRPSAKQLDDAQKRAMEIREKVLDPHDDIEKLANGMQNEKTTRKKKKPEKQGRSLPDSFTPCPPIDGGSFPNISPKEKVKIIPVSRLREHDLPGVVVRKGTEDLGSCKRFGAVRVDHPCGGTLCVANTGGRSAAGDWCPTPIGSSHFLAVAVQCCDDIGDPMAVMHSTSCIQVWGLDIDSEEMSLEYVVLLRDTPVWDVKFCPTVPPNSDRIGVLAVSLGNGIVTVLCMPSPSYVSSLNKRTEGTIVLDIQEFSKVQMKGDNCTSMKLAWSRVAEEGGGASLAVGLADGTIGILRLCPRTDKLILVDRLNYGNSPCTGVCWSPQSPFLMVSCYHGDPVMVWDVRNTRVPLYSHNVPMYWCSDIRWIAEAALLVSGFEKSIWVSPKGGDAKGSAFSDDNVDSIMSADVLLMKKESMSFYGGNDGKVYRHFIWGAKHPKSFLKVAVETSNVYVDVAPARNQGEREAQCRLQENPGSITFVKAQNMTNTGRFVMTGSANTLHVWINACGDAP